MSIFTVFRPLLRTTVVIFGLDLLLQVVDPFLLG